MAKKIGVITVHKNTNYGANLQAFASCKYINNVGFDCSVIDYTLPEHDKANYLFSWLKQSWDGEKNKSLSRKVKLFISLALSAGWKNKKLKSFFKFRKNHIKLTRQLKTVNDIEKLNLDSIVCGSDQVWNPDIIGSVNPIFFGDINGVKNKIAYAPSVGRDKYFESDEQVVKNLIEKMDYLSVREEDTAKYLSNLSGKAFETVCDPVFLLDKAEYDKVLYKRKIKGDYVLLYSVIHNAELTKVAKDYADKKGLKLIEIATSKEKGATHKQILTYGPSEFLSAFKYAKTVFTNSFHGTAFSIVFEKDFYVFDNKHRGSRITNVLNKAGITNRLISDVIKNDYEPIDYAVVNDKVSSYVQSSKEFLEKALNADKSYLAGDKCVSCGACKNVCKLDAIKLIKDKQGFITSVVDNKKCVDCGLCKKVCPALNEVCKSTESKEVYAFKASDEIRKQSASGGAFTAIAKSVLDKGGVVYGAYMNDFSTEHIRCESIEDLKLVQGTKYLPSDVSKCYAQIENDLKGNKIVLFSGTPCQVDGVKRYLTLKNIPTENFYSIDIICHGVPSPKVFNEYKKWLEGKHGLKVSDYKFRSKKISWRGSSTLVTFDNGKELKNTKDACGFMNLYYSNNITRESCYSCKYTSKERVSDITVSDYWGIENLDKSFEDGLGVSMVVINSDSGKALFESIEGVKITANLETAKQPQLIRPTDKPNTYCDFWSEFETNGVESVLKKYGAIKESFKTKLYNLKKKILK